MGEIDELYKALEVSNAEGLKLDTENVRLRHTVAVQVATIAKAEARIVELKEEVEHERNEKLTISEVDKSTIDFMREIMTKLKQEKAELDREIANFKATLTDANLYTLKLLDRIAELEAALAAAIELADLQAVDITELKRANAVLAGAMDKADAQVGRVSRENADLQDELREVTAVGMRDGLAAIAWYQKYTELKHNLASSLEANKWHLVSSEGYPSEDKSYFAYCADSGDHWTAEEYYSADNGWSVFDGVSVVAWMPLPEPPQECDPEEVPQQ